MESRRARAPRAASSGGERFDAPGASDPDVVAWDPLRGPPDSILPRFHPRPVRVAIEGLTAFDVGRAHACAIDGARALHCWGSNANDEIGAYADPSAPHRVAEGVSELDAGPFYTCFTREGRQCLGAPSDLARTTRGEVITLEDTFGSLACVIEDARVRCESVGAWTPTGLELPEVEGVRALALGAYHGCLAREDGSVRCWGQSMMGQLGPGPQPLPDLRATALGAGPFRTCALTSDATVVCWGDTERGAAGGDPSRGRHVAPTILRRPL